jgi:hypothetical protein
MQGGVRGEPLPGQDEWTYRPEVTHEQRRLLLLGEHGDMDEHRRVRPETAQWLEHPVVEQEQGE